MDPRLLKENLILPNILAERKAIDEEARKKKLS